MAQTLGATTLGKIQVLPVIDNAARIRILVINAAR
jgi:hypothetical protein